MKSKLVGAVPVALAATVITLVLAPQAQARETAKFKVLSIDGTTTSTRDTVYDPSDFGSCAFTMTERIRFHSTKQVTAYAFTSKSHGRARVAWSPLPEYTHNFTVVDVPGEVTVSRSATYQQTNYVDPDTGEVYPGCHDERFTENCAVERTFPATLRIGGTSGTDESTYVELLLSDRAMDELHAACPVLFLDPHDDDPGLFARADLFKKGPKRLSDTDRSERKSFDHEGDGITDTGTIVEELTAELKRRKSRR
jgi:hypothetical protein